MKRKLVEEDVAVRSSVEKQFPLPSGAKEFREGYFECIQMYALHAPNKRGVGRILDEYCITLEDACMRDMKRENIARYEGYRQAIKDLRKMKKIR